jgi:DNA-binding NarL/FixJ family response regulator
MFVSLADNQDITRAGMMYVCQEFDCTVMHRAEDKTELIEQLRQQEEAVVILDYTHFDIND